MKAESKLFKKWFSRWPLIFAILGLAFVACSTGTYPVDIFTEMHYQQSYRSQEPPRLMTAEGNVPFTNESEPLQIPGPTLQIEAITMPNPISASDGVLQQGQKIFVRNCSMCHGLTGQSDSFISVTFKSLGIKEPANFVTAGSIAGSPNDGSKDGLAFWIITDGTGNMPSFRHLLSNEDRWAVIHYLRFLSQQADS